MFDWWILLTASILSAESRERVAQAAAERLQPRSFADRVVAELQQMQTLRALLWLGDAAIPILEAIGLNSLDPKSLRFLACQTQSPAVRQLLNPTQVR